MRNKLVTAIAVLALAAAGSSLGSTLGKLIPTPAALFGSTPASAEGLTAQPAGPLTPSPVGSGFTYQGKLLNNGSPTNG
ncbi:MAG TPA: hypothetical protein VM409_03735, partial [Chloroflexia bacterium]|nr:hypothetical protein [Chloroflexia bacterium]